MKLSKARKLAKQSQLQPPQPPAVESPAPAVDIPQPEAPREAAPAILPSKTPVQPQSAASQAAHTPRPDSRFHRKFTQADLRVVVFQMADNDYVAPVTEVQEIILLNELIRMPNAPEYVEGLIQRRGRIIPVIDLRKQLRMPLDEHGVDACVLIIRLKFGPVGFIVDSASELIMIKTRDFEVPSQVIAGIDRLYLQGVAYLDQRLLIMLDFEQLLTPAEQAQLGELASSAAQPEAVDTLFAGQSTAAAQTSAGQTHADLLNLLIFELSDELYCVPMTAVFEVREPLAWMPLPDGRAAPHVLGLVNLRGLVLPVLDLRRRFDLAIKQNSNDNRLIVLHAAGSLVALWADAVRGLMRLPRTLFQPAPPDVARIDPEYYDQVATVDGRMLIELNIQKLLAETAAGALGEAS